MINKENHLKTKLRNAKILIVEDNDDQWVIMQQALRQSMSEVTVQRVSSLTETLTLLNEWQHQEWEIPKLILLDLYLPNHTDGLQLLQQIRAMPTSISKVPIVMLTTSNQPSDIVEAYRLGISAYMVKPMEFEDWLSCFGQLRTYWLETVTLPQVYYRL